MITETVGGLVEGGRTPFVRRKFGDDRPAARLLMAAVLFVGLWACASVPIKDVQLYVSTYEQVRAGGDLLLDEIAPFVSASSAGPAGATRDCGVAKGGYPNCFVPLAALGAEGSRASEDIAIKARRTAIHSLMLYNSMLLDLASGKTVTEIQQRFDELLKLVTVVGEIAAVPSGGLSALVPVGAEIVRRLVTRLEQARVSALIREALIESKDDIQTLFQLLIEDTPRMYEIYKLAREKQVFELNDLKNRARLSGNLEQQLVYEKRIGEVNDQIKAFHASLGAYVRVLHSSSTALDPLVQSARSKRFSIEEALVIAREAGELRVRVMEFWNLARSVRQPR